MADSYDEPEYTDPPQTEPEPTHTDADFTVDDVADETLPVLAVEKYHVGVTGAVQPFSPEAQALIAEPIDPELVEVRPDGQIYLPGIFYQEKLDKTFGQGAWVLVRLDDGINQDDSTVYFRGALFVEGRFRAEATGEKDYYPGKKGMTRARSLESARTECLKRCCKHLGISLELWKPQWVRNWLANNAKQVWCTNVGTGADSGKKKPLWRKISSPPIDQFPWREGPAGSGDGDGDSSPQQRPAQKPTQRPATQPKAQPAASQKPAAPAGPPTRPWNPGQLSTVLLAKATKREASGEVTAATPEALDSVCSGDLGPLFNHEPELAWAFLDYVFTVQGNIERMVTGFDTSLGFNEAQLNVTSEWARSENKAATQDEARQFVLLLMHRGLWKADQVAEMTQKVQAKISDDQLPF